MRVWMLAGIVLGMGSVCAGEGLERVKISKDGKHFVRGKGEERVVFWGVNYDRDDAGRLLEDYWEQEWETVEGDFREMKALGVNLVRVHLQARRFLNDAKTMDAGQLARLGRLIELAEKVGVYLDVTGLGCYHKKAVPPWYAEMKEEARWEAQGVFWKGVARVCRGKNAVFCYDLMNEPIVGGGEAKRDWLPGEPLAGEHFVQRITTDVKGREEKAIARAWVAKMTGAIREVDRETLVTVGVIPWSQTFPGAGPQFYEKGVGEPLDFVSVHFYPRKGKFDEDMKALKVYELGKPILIEEIFPMSAGAEETLGFIEKTRPMVEGWVSFYWGKTIEENEAKKGMKGAIVGEWLRTFRGSGQIMTRTDSLRVR